MKEPTRLEELLALAEALLYECRIWILSRSRSTDETERFELIALIDKLEKQINDELRKTAE